MKGDTGYAVRIRVKEAAHRLEEPRFPWTLDGAGAGPSSFCHHAAVFASVGAPLLWLVGRASAVRKMHVGHWAEPIMNALFSPSPLTRRIPAAL
jgi:hypothetical protein